MSDGSVHLIPAP